MSAKVLRLKQVGKFEDLEYRLHNRGKVVGDEVRVVVKGCIMGLNKRIIRMFILQISGGHTRTLTLLSGCFCGWVLGTLNFLSSRGVRIS